MTYRSSFFCEDENAMLALGRQLAYLLPVNSLVTLEGELGAGKSFLARAIIHAAGFQGRVKSPTYTLIETYNIKVPLTGLSRIAHLDLYRLADPDELHYLGFDELIDSNDLVLIEWAERAADLMPRADVHIHIDYADAGGRSVRIESIKPIALKQLDLS